MKKRLIAVIAAGMMVLSAFPPAFAVTPKPADNTEQVQTEEQQQTEEQIPAVNTVEAQTADTELVNNKYLTKGGAAFWFIFTIILNIIVSFWIGNRFYRLSRKDNHVAGEIRALRKDVEEKFAASIGGFAEAEVDISNSNESYASDNEGIKPPDKKPQLREVSAEEEERFRKWEEQQSRSAYDRRRGGDKPSPRSAVREELDGELDEVRRIKKKNYQPKREEDGVFETRRENLDETKEIKLKGDAVKNKAKEILGDIFPFKED